MRDIYRNRRLESGQAFVLMVIAISITASTLALFTLSQSQNSFRNSIENRRTIDIIYNMNAVARWLQQTYYYDAGCDPYVFNNKINELSRRTWSSRFARQSLDAASPPFQVQIGEITSKTWGSTMSAAMMPFGAPPPFPQNASSMPVPLGTATSGSLPAYYSSSAGMYGPQDVSVTFWMHPFGIVNSKDNGTRYEQTIALINTCTFTDPSTTPPVLANAFTPQYSPGPQFGAISSISAYGSASSTQMPGTSAAQATCKGDVNGDGKVDLFDRTSYQNWIKNGDSGSSAAPIGSNPCMDLNHDGLHNEIDATILDKALKGYLYFTAPSYQ